ncbi:LITAF-like zinc ribbon domain-containing protein [Phycomyces blakesleeanus]|uniref:LITAF domain-containing protein n=2 Tax=Phycomyces blakesleeanus TaxID=4837 RepID=A0A162YCE9_PHYB8|nr:hypothetical protein PHYBLDRAFT_162794 [Phycomyces blakesleeanus NRRL 1555(-)]OAD79735.1 hypothetical protein PHYBLDRAFT_162794 [Phycomyces blakesleeanus NRRL 1555(-)]|eukprot:XP_018297775.1 hypothetical protein PHYBLDRAFT_162794 [Phycomyces blakesleeanus NRRL 1555(-)]
MPEKTPLNSTPVGPPNDPPPYTSTSASTNARVPPAPNTSNTMYGSAAAPCLLSPTIYPPETLRTKPANTICPHCHQSVLTVTKNEGGTATILGVVALYLCGWHHGGCLIPCCLPCVQDVNHLCPNCNTRIAKFDRFEQSTVVK